LGFPVVDTSQSTQQSDTEILAVPNELASSIQEIINLYHYYKEQNDDHSVIESLRALIAIAKGAPSYLQLNSLDLVGYSGNLDGENETDFLKSWDDIFNVQVYIDTDIYGELDSRPPALVEMDMTNIDSETVIQHAEATEAYVQSWKELAQSMSSFPDDLFTRLWPTVEIAKIFQCSPSSLRRFRRNGRLPIKIDNFILDCISHDGKRSLWFVRPV
jgi:hypothetical protein